FTITITATDSHGESTSATPTVLVSNAPPRLMDVTVTSPIYGLSNAVLHGSILDPGVKDTFTLAVDWGDGSVLQNFNYPAGTAQFAESHVYLAANPNFIIHVSLLDDDSGTDSIDLPVTVKSFAEAARFLGLDPLENGHVRLRLAATP